MKALPVLSLVALVSLTGCAHGLMRGSVAMKANKEEAHVCMGDGEVKAGDRVTLFKNECTTDLPGKRGYNKVCKKVKLGGGVVERTLDEHYSVVKVDPGVAFEEGTVVEKD